jgi:two-component system phosphate regulon sensor histidine kinase PhoR
LGFFAITYLIVRFFLSEVVFRKIRLIYKIIHDSKAQGGNVSDKPLDVLQTDLNIVNDEVMKWAKNTESEIENLKKLEIYRRNFLGNISHELKTPIFSIQGYLHTLLDGGLNDEKINMRYIERAVSNADRLQNIVDDLEVINKLEEGTSLDISKFDIKELVDEVYRDLEMLADEKRIKLNFDKSFNRSFIVEADKEKIRQVLNNLISNSIKYGNDKGKTKIGFHDMEDHVLIEVSDDGIGISEAHLIHVFDRFYRVDSSRSRKLGGSGLGLAIVKHILEAHQQTITVKSKVGKGSTFSFTLKKMK